MIIFVSLFVPYPVFCIVNMVVILDSWMATIVNFMGSSENRKKKKKKELHKSLCLRTVNLPKTPGQCSSGLQCHSVGFVTYFGLRV